jgi:hypothetical protein
VYTFLNCNEYYSEINTFKFKEIGKIIVRVKDLISPAGLALNPTK